MIRITLLCALLFFQFSASLCAVTVCVNDSGDESALFPGNSPHSGPGRVTLRSAIEHINAIGEASNTITFSLNASPFVIQPGALGSPNEGIALPPITVPVAILGYSPEAYTSKNNRRFSDNAKLAICIEGPGAAIPAVISGLTLDVGSDGSLVEGLAIINFIGDGLERFGAGITIKSNHCKILGNYLGVDLTGSKVVPNLSGIIVHGNGNRIGSKHPRDRNLIAGNLLGLSEFYSGRNFEGNQLLPYPIGGLFISGSANVVQNNFFGTDSTGNQKLLNDVAIRLCGNRNTITANVINAGFTAVQIIGIPNTYFGKAIPPGKEAGTGNIVTHNLIGTHAKGNKPFSSPGIGVHLVYGPLNGIKPQNNLIDSNRISGFSKGIQLGAVNTPVLNNHISNNIITHNSLYGILATNASFTLIDSNVISLNGFYGIYLTDQVTDNIIQGNLIGTDRLGMQALPNGHDGIKIASPYYSNWWHLPVQQNRSTSIVGNIISGNKENGIHIASNTTSNIIQDNWIGLSSDGSRLGNGGDGIRIDASFHNLIGGSPLSGISLQGNSIAFNGGAGVRCSDESNLVVDNHIWDNGNP